MNEDWPDWLPRGARISITLTAEQRNYIIAVFNDPPRIHTLDGVTLCGDVISGVRPAIKKFARRFSCSDIDISNIESVI